MYQRAKYHEDKTSTWQGIQNPIATVKYDGANFFVRVEQDGSLRYFSRRPSVKGGFPERTAQLPHLTDKKMPEYAGQVVNVELIHTGHKKDIAESHPKLSGILNSGVQRSIETQRTDGPVRAVLFDVIDPALPTYEDKLVHLKKFEKTFGKPDVMFVPPVATTPESISKLINSTKATGREGVVITSRSVPEYMNRRLKIKHTTTYNLKVHRVVQEVDIYGKLKESAGALGVIDRAGREVALVGTGFTRAEREDIWKNPKNWIGKLIQVKTLGTVKAVGRLRAPVYNGDADGELDLIE